MVDEQTRRGVVRSARVCIITANYKQMLLRDDRISKNNLKGMTFAKIWVNSVEIDDSIACNFVAGLFCRYLERFRTLGVVCSSGGSHCDVTNSMTLSNSLQLQNTKFKYL